MALSHPFVERLIGTVRREYLDRMLFWTTADLETKLIDFQHYACQNRLGCRIHVTGDGADTEAWKELGMFAEPGKRR